MKHVILNYAKELYQKYKDYFSSLALQEKLDDKDYLVGEGLELSEDQEARKSPTTVDGLCFFPLLSNKDVTIAFSDFLKTLRNVSFQEKDLSLHAFHESLEEIDKLEDLDTIKAQGYDGMVFSELLSQKLDPIFKGHQKPASSPAAMAGF
jgi:hypothetical protein